MRPIDETLRERGKTHGDYHEQAEFAGALRDLFQTAGKWKALTRVEKDAALMIAVKLSRILTGNPHYADSWVDVAGYATLVVKDIEAYSVPNVEKGGR